MEEGFGMVDVAVFEVGSEHEVVGDGVWLGNLVEQVACMFEHSRTS